MAQGSFTVVQVSDCHLNPLDADSMGRFKAVRERIEALKPDYVVASGDISDDGFRNDGMFEQLKTAFEKWSVPVLVIPGNHDIGDKMGEANEIKQPYLDRWLKVFGKDRFAEPSGNWLLLGLNTQVVGSGLHHEADQLQWMDKVLDQAQLDGRQVAVFLHAAAYLFDPDEVLSDGSQYWGFDPFPRRELVRRLHMPHVRLVANGHLHWHQIVQRGAAKWVWCPSTDLIVDDAIFPRGGGVIGLIRYTFDDGGVEPQLVELDMPARKVHVFRPTVELPGRDPVTMAELVLDFTGTLSKDGRLLPGVAEKLKDLAKRIRITVMTADTFGTAREALAGLPLDFERVETGADKQRFIEGLGPQHTVAIGNGRNDVPMVKAAAIGVAVIGPEGADGELLRVADVVVNNIYDALDLVANPMRLKATMRA